MKSYLYRVNHTEHKGDPVFVAFSLFLFHFLLLFVFWVFFCCVLYCIELFIFQAKTLELTQLKMRTHPLCLIIMHPKLQNYT